MSLTKITEKKFNEAIDIYFLWKELNSKIKNNYTRGVNIHEYITESITCYVNDFSLSLKGSSEDAVDNNNLKIQIKATSNFNSDLTSFGPKSEFDILHFVRLNQDEDIMYLYQIPTIDLLNIEVKKGETFLDQQNQGRRPRFSIIEKFINDYKLSAYSMVNLKTKEVTYF